MGFTHRKHESGEGASVAERGKGSSFVSNKRKFAGFGDCSRGDDPNALGNSEVNALRDLKGKGDAGISSVVRNVRITSKRTAGIANTTPDAE